MLKFKKLLAIICALSLLASALIVSASAEENTRLNWDGTVAESFSGGDGSQSSPYLISNSAQLAKCVTMGGAETEGKYFKLTNNIVINADLKNNPTSWYHTVYNAPEDNRTFSGIFDGNGFTVSGLYHNGDSGAFGAVGLFPAITVKTRIKNLGIVNSEINSGYYAGAFVGTLVTTWIGWSANGYSDDYPSIVNSFAGENVTVNAAFAGGFAGVVTGSSYFSIHNCSFTGKLKGFEKNGAEAGDYWGAYIFVTNTFTTSPLNASQAPSFLRNNAPIYVTAADSVNPNSGTLVKLTDEQAKGENARTNMPDLNFDTIWQTNEDGYPSLRVFSTDAPSVWDKSVNKNFNGAGTADSPYLIETAAQLAGLVTSGKAATTGKYYRMTRDMDVSAGAWYMSTGDGETNVFNGTFDGAGHIVSGIKISTDEGGWGTGCGLFPAISNDTHIKNVGIKNMDIDRWGWASSNGAIFGFAELSNAYDPVDGDQSTKYPTIEYCFADETATRVKATYTGGIGGTVCGSGFIRISNCFFTGNTTGGYGQCGAIGNIYGSVAFVNNFYSTSSFSVTEGANNNIKYFNSYTTSSGLGTVLPGTQLSAEQMTGDSARDNMAGFDFDSVWQVNADGKPTLRVFGKTTLSNVVISSSNSYGTNGVNGTKFVARTSLAGMNLDEIKGETVYAKVKGEIKTVAETGMIISRSGAADYSLFDIKNDPVTGYRIAGYVKGNVNTDKLDLKESAVTVSATVKGTYGYSARAYTLFTDGTAVFGDKYSAEPEGTASADGFTVNDTYKTGDADFNGSINISDLIRIKKYSAGIVNVDTGLITDIIDVNGDGAFNAADMAALKKALLSGSSSEEPQADWQLVWNDEFDSAAISTDKWNFADHMGGYTDMPTISDKSVQSVKKNEAGDSYLHLTAYKYGDEYRTVKSVSTDASMNFKYGYVEMRVKMPTGKGVWPSFWLKSVPQNDNYLAEVDIAEIMGTNTAISNLHKWYTDGAHNTSGAGKYYTVSDNEWHTYGMLWNKDKIIMYVDGNEIASYDLNTNFGSTQNGMDGFRDPMYLIINNHIITEGYSSTANGEWAKGLEAGPDFTESVYDIDYVRLYQKNDGSSEINLLK